MDNARLNEKKLMKCGMYATIIKYDSCKDIDIKFDDETIVKNRTYRNFELGNIKNPNLKNSKIVDRTGEIRLMVNGQKAKIIAYRTKIDLDVMFEDGTIVKNKKYTNFKRGSIGNPNYHPLVVDKTGTIKMMHCGLNAKIIRYKNSNDIDIQFLDGTILKNKTYNQFSRCKIAHPNLINNGIFNNFKINNLLYRNTNVGLVLYDCYCLKCGLERCCTPMDMLEHKCNERTL